MVQVAERMQSSVSAWVDRTVLRVMSGAWRSGAGNDPELENRRRRAFEVYTEARLQSSPRDFFKKPDPARVEVRGYRSSPYGRVETLCWPSRYQTWDPTFQASMDGYAANRTCYAEAAWHTDRVRPTIVCIHAWMASHYRLQRRVFLRRHLHQLGFNVVLVTMPFHGARTPEEAWFGGQLFPGRCPQLTNEAFGQLIWDLRSLLGYLHGREGCSVGVLGMSLGGYATALLASVEPELAFAIPIIPVVDLPELMCFHAADRPDLLERETGGRTLEDLQALYAVHSPLRHRPAIESGRLLIIGGRGDRICRPDHVGRLWEHWQRPKLHWWPGGHVTHFGRDRSFEVIGDFLKATAPQ